MASFLAESCVRGVREEEEDGGGVEDASASRRSISAWALAMFY